MDALAAILDGPRAREALVLRVSMDPPWRIDVLDEAPLSIVAVTSGHAIVSHGDADPVELLPGDVAIFRGPDAYTVSDGPGRAPHVEVYEGGRCVLVDGTPVDELLLHGVRSWGTSPDGPDQWLVGTYLVDGDVSDRLLSALPPFAVVRRAEWDPGLVAVLDAEATRTDPGQGAVLDRLVDLMLISALRAWFTADPNRSPGWYRAHRDPEVGAALRALHLAPEAPWTVGSLAAEVGLSRATLARRFSELVGEAPMTYLTNWRLSLAADRLREPGTTVAAIAAEVGYQSPDALSSAFKRVRGMSPRDHVRATRAVSVG